MIIKQVPETFDDFCKLIVKEEIRYLKVLCLLTNYESWRPPGRRLELESFFRKHDFDIQGFGEGRKLSKEYYDRLTEETIQVEYYAYVRRPRLLFCFSRNKPKAIEDTMDPIIKETGIYYLWLPPSTFDDVRNAVLSKYPYAKITFFSGNRTPSTGFECEIRPEHSRRILYYGEDGIETLKEFTHYYGILPQSMKFHVPGVADFRINNNGLFTLIRGDLNFFFDIIRKATISTVRIRKIVEESRFDVLPLKTAKKELKVPFLVPWIIDFSRPLEYDDGENLIEILGRNNFALYNYVLMSGSVILDSTVVDELKKSVFTISMNSHRMIIAPRYDSTFDSFLRFLQTITENLDPHVECKQVIEA